jgi:sugar lactone lactonase YvrE
VAPGRADAAYEWVREWPVPDQAAGIAVAPGGVYITQSGTALHEPSIQRYSLQGQLLGQWGDVGTGSGQLTDPSAIDIDASGRLWVVDGFGEIIVFTPEGARVDYRSITDSCGDGVEILLHDIEIDPIGEMYFPFYDNCELSSGGDPREGVIRSNTNWQILGDWGDSGPADGQFSSPGAVASDGRGSVYVADSSNYRIQQFTPDGTFVRKWGQLGGEPGHFNGLGNIEIGPGGDLFAVDRSNQRIQRFAPNGTFIEQYTIPENVEYGGLPADLDFDAQGNLYLLGTEGYETVDEVHVFRPTGGGGGASGVAIPKQKLRHRNGKIKVKLACSAAGPCDGKLQIRKGKKAKLAKGKYELAAGESGKAVAKATKKGRALLKRTNKLKVTVELRPQGGGEKVTKKLALRG